MNLNCEWCKSSTKQIYRLKNGFLCPICAEKHYNSIVKKLEKHIQEVENGIANRKVSLDRLKQEMCKHENIIDTGYSKFFSVEVTKSIWKCPDCGKIIYK